jgi:serine protease Do
MLSNALVALCLAVQWGSPAGGFSQAVIQQAYETITPAICMVSYTSEVTDPATGQVGRRANRALGVICTPDGLVLAHGHMALENSEPYNIEIQVGQGDAQRSYEAMLLEKPDDVNLAFLEIQADEPRRFPYVEFSPRTLALGEPLLILGIMGESLDFVRAIQMRQVSAILEKPRRTYCLDQPMPFGFMTGPVVDAKGVLVGVVGLDLSPEQGGELYTRSQHPLVYQADLFVRYLEERPGETVAGEEPPAWLGVFSQPLTDDLADYWGVPQEGGIVVATIVPGSPADAAGIQRGDIITRFDDTVVRPKLDREVVTFTKLVRETGVGKRVEVNLLRNGNPTTVQVELVERPKAASDAGEYEDEVFGLTVREITQDVRILLNLPEDIQGVIVRRVKSGSVADAAGMAPGVIILRFGEHPVTSLDEFKDAIGKVIEEKPSEVAAFCRFGPRTGYFRLIPRWNGE